MPGNICENPHPNRMQIYANIPGHATVPRYADDEFSVANIKTLLSGTGHGGWIRETDQQHL